MSVKREGDSSKEMTLAFDLSAIELCARPKEVFTDAREWSRYVGVIANETEAVASFVHNHGFQQDFELGDRDKWLALEEIQHSTDTDRHVFVGTTTDDELAARQTGWEFIHIREVAEKADWSIREERASDRGIISRVIARLFG